MDSSAAFTVARTHQIVQAFDNQRGANPLGTRTVGPAAGDRTIYRLGYGDDHRGATWYDRDERVVWLAAYRLHRSGEKDDAFPYFQELISTKALLPTEDDYTALFDDRGHRFAEMLYQDAQRLLGRARSNPGVEQVGVLGGEKAAGVVVEIVETLEETYVAFSVSELDTSRIVMLLGAFNLQAEFRDWESVSTFPTRALRFSDGEICYRLLRQS